jgi:hypothetical protein
MADIANAIEGVERRRRVAPLTVVLGVVFVFFCAILVFVYVATKRANPIMLDQDGKPLNSESQPTDGGKR